MSTMIKAAFALSCLFLAASLPGGSAVDKLKLSSGYEIPVIGLGTSTFKPEEIDKAITNALENGYRHIDTAFSYNNEEAIGKALKKWFAKGGKREELFITSKLPFHGNRPQSVEKYLKRSLKDLDLDYIDLYLIHGPFAVKEAGNLQADANNALEPIDHIALWKEMEKQVKSGRTKSIGLSNFNESQILNVYENAEIKPSNLEVESSAYLQQRSLREFCKKHKIVMTAYAPLGSHETRSYLYKGTEKDLPPLTDLPEIKKLAQKYKKTPGQILLRHTIQDGLVAIPKSSNAGRQKDNINIFDFALTNEEMKMIYTLDKGEKGRVFDFLAWYPGLKTYPQYPFPLAS